MCDKGLIELVDDSYKVKQTKERELIKRPQPNSRINIHRFLNQRLQFFQKPKNSAESLFLRKSLSTKEIPSAQSPTPKRPAKHSGEECTHNLVLFQNLLKEMEEIKRFTKSIERKFEKLEMALQNISGKSNGNYSNNDKSPLLLEVLKKSHIQFRKRTDGKRCNQKFLLKQKSETNNNRSSVNKTVTENDEILEIERRNSSPSSNSK